MVVGWRMGSDVEAISNLPDGTVVFDVLSGSAKHSSGVQPTLWVSGELQAWFKKRLLVLRIPEAEISEATLEVGVRTDRIRTIRKTLVSFDFTCKSTLVTSDRTYEGALVEKHTYHNRSDA